MRIIIFFDLPTTSSVDLKEYRNFRKEIIKLGFMMLQESVYVRIALNASVQKSLIKKIKAIKPPKGLVQVLSITEKQFSSMDTIVGTFSSDTLTSDERMIIL